MREQLETLGEIMLIAIILILLISAITLIAICEPDKPTWITPCLKSHEDYNVVLRLPETICDEYGKPYCYVPKNYKGEKQCLEQTK